MIKSFLKDVLIYALPMFLARAVSLILLPIYTRQLGPTDFGFVEFVTATSVILLLVVPLEVNQAIGRMLSEKKSIENEQIITSTAIWFTVVMFALFTAVVYLFRFELLDIAKLSRDYEQYTVIICVHLAVMAIINLLQVQLRFSNQAKSSVIVNITMVLANLAFVLYFLKFDKLDIWYYFLSQVLSGCIAISIGLILLALKFDSLFFLRHLNTPILKILLTYSLPLVWSSVGVALSSSFDRLIVGSYVGLSELGYYGAAIRLSAVIGLGFYVISSAITPIVYREHTKNETKLLIEKVMSATTYACIAILLLVTIYAREIVVLFLGDRFTQASRYIFYVLLSMMIANLYIFFLGMDIEKRTKVLTKINLSAGFLAVVSSAIFVPIFGVWGAISSTLISNLLRLSGYVYFSQRLYPIKVSYVTCLLAVLMIIALNILINVGT